MTWVDLLKKNFSQYIKNDLFCYNEFQIPLTEHNRERILCMLTVGRMVPLSDNKSGDYRMEYFIHDKDNDCKKPIDAALILSQASNEFIAGTVESKINVSDGSTLETTLRVAVEQTYDHYLDPARKNGKLLDLGKEPNLFVSIAIYNPDVFLARDDNLQNYLNSTETNVVTRFERFGFVILTALVNTNTIRMRQELVDLFKDRLHDNKPRKQDSFSFITPLSFNFLGRVSKGESKHDLTIRTKLGELEKLPFFNPNPVSDINNVRNFTEERKDKLQADILESLLSAHAQTMPGMDGISEEEAHRSLGAKSRILSYNENQTMVILEMDNGTHNGNSHVKYVTTDMSITDGQHSSLAFIDILKVSKNSVPDLSTQKIINTVYKNGSNINWSDFSRYLSCQHIEIAVSGFKNSKNAQAAARNQNSTRSQTSLEKKINANRGLIVKLADVWNEHASTLKLCFNKSAYDQYPNSDWIRLNPSIIVPVYALWRTPTKSAPEISKTNTDYNNFLAKVGSRANAAIGNYFENALDWFFLNNVESVECREILDKVNVKLDELRLNTDVMAEDDIKDDLERLIKKLNKLNIPNVKRRLVSIENAIEDEDFDDASKHVQIAQNIMVKLTEVDIEKVKATMMINKVAFNALKTKVIPFLAQVDTQYYFLNLFNLHVRDFYKHKQIDDISQIKESDLDIVLDDVINRLDAAEKSPHIAKKSMQMLKFATHSSPMDTELYKILFE